MVWFGPSSVDCQIEWIEMIAFIELMGSEPEWCMGGPCIGGCGD